MARNEKGEGMEGVPVPGRSGGRGGVVDVLEEVGEVRVRRESFAGVDGGGGLLPASTVSCP